jgi:hypothetical protein
VIASSAEAIANQIIKEIDDQMRMNIKSTGLIHMVNGIDSIQSKYYIKIHCLTKTLSNIMLKIKT